MTKATRRDWSDTGAAAEELAGNWQRFDCFCWFRGRDLSDAANWMIFYTSSPQSGLIEASNQNVMANRLAPFAAGDDPDLVYEGHSHWVVNSLTGFSLRVFRADGSPTPAFVAFCGVQEALDGYPILDEQEYGDREYAATLDNYRGEMWRIKDELPEGWEAEVHAWFGDHGHDDFTESRDDRGGWAPRDEITKALTGLGLLPRIVLA